MHEKSKNEIKELLKSKDLREYIKEILKEQTKDILEEINKELLNLIDGRLNAQKDEIISVYTKKENNRLNDEYNDLKAKLDDEKEKNSNLEQEIQKVRQDKLDVDMQLQSVTTEKEDAIKKLEDYENKNARLNDQIQDLGEKFKREQTKNSDLEQQIQTVKQDKLDVDLQLQSVTTEKENAIKKLEDYENKNARLNYEIQDLGEKFKREQTKNSDLEQQIRAVTTEKENAIIKLEDYENKFSIINMAYSNYKNLPENLKQRLCNIFKKDNICSFINAVSDWDTIEGLWDFTKKRIIDNETIGLDELIGLSVNSFSLYSQSDASGKYELFCPTIGEPYDSDKHDQRDYKTNGVIQEVLLKGIVDNTKKVVRKAYVKIQ